MIIETPSRRMAWAARLCRCFPPAISGRLGNLLYPYSLALREDAPFVARSSLGDVSFAYERAGLMALSFALRGFYEWRNVVIANSICQPGDTILDVGSNFGTETILFALVVGRNGRVVAFEPLPQAFEVLAAAVRRNNLEQVQLHQCAVGAQRGTFAFAVPTNDRNMGTGSLVDADADVAESIEVDVLTLDDLLASAQFDHPKLMVMDVEGAEFDVLRGAARLLEKHQPTIVLEVNPPLLAQRGFTVAAARSFLEERSYQCHQITSWGLRTPDPSAGNSNWICFARNNDPDRQARRVSRALRRAALLPLWRGLNPAVVGGKGDRRA